MTSLSTRRTEVETGPGSSGISTVRSGEMYYWYLPSKANRLSATAATTQGGIVPLPPAVLTSMNCCDLPVFVLGLLAVFFSNFLARSTLYAYYVVTGPFSILFSLVRMSRHETRHHSVPRLLSPPITPHRYCISVAYKNRVRPLSAALPARHCQAFVFSTTRSTFRRRGRTAAQRTEEARREQ